MPAEQVDLRVREQRKHDPGFLAPNWRSGCALSRSQITLSDLRTASLFSSRPVAGAQIGTNRVRVGLRGRAGIDPSQAWLIMPDVGGAVRGRVLRRPGGGRRRPGTLGAEKDAAYELENSTSRDQCDSGVDKRRPMVKSFA